MYDLQKYLPGCLLATVALFGGAYPAFAADAPSLGTASSFVVLSATPGVGGEVTCTDSAITGDIGSSGAQSAVVQTRCTIPGAIIAPVSAQVLTDVNSAFDALAAVSCDQTLTGTLGGVALAPGVYCFEAAAVLTGTLTLAGPSNGVWIFKTGTAKTGVVGSGALTGTSFSVVMAGGAQPCNVFWTTTPTEAATMTDSDFKGTILSGAAITSTRGTFVGRALAKAAVTFTGVAATGCYAGNANQAAFPFR